MTYRLLADAVVAFHFAFIVFVIAGGALAFHRAEWAMVHLPAAAWGAYTEFTSTVCPLTPWENALRRAAGDAGYGGSFIDHYLIPIIYPAGLTSSIQLVLGCVVVASNVAIYAGVWWHWRRRRLPRV